MPSHTCAACSTETEQAAICSRCKKVWYCNAACQRGHWKTHKPQCKAPPSVEEALTAPAAVPSAAVDASLSAMLGGGKSAPAPTTAASGKKGAAASSSRASSSSSSAASKSSSAAAPVEVTFSLPPGELHAEHPLLEVRELAGRGRGFVAREAIEPGTLLLTEASIYAHAAYCSSSEEARIAALAALTQKMLERYPDALASLCHHADHELPRHKLLDSSPLPDVSLDQWRAALARVDSNCFTSSRGMMCSPSVSICNHSCYPNADLIIREVPATASAASDASTAAASDASFSDKAAAPRVVEQCYLYAIQPIAAGDEVCINYLGQDSLCRWYAPAMLRQESFGSQWQFQCKCNRCEGNKARAIDKTIAYSASGLDEALEERYAKLVLADQDESASPDPRELLQLYRDIFVAFDGERFYHHYLLHQLRSMLLFMPAAFDGRAHAQSSSGKGASDASAMARAEAEWLQLVEHHLLSLRNNLLHPPLHSIKADTLAVMMRSSDFIGLAAADNEARSRAGSTIVPNQPLRKRIAELAQEHDDVYFEDPAFRTLYPDVFAQLQQALA